MTQAGQRSKVVVVTTVVICFLIVGCSRDTAAGARSALRLRHLANNAARAGSTEQAVMLADGRVDQAEYAEAVASARKCQAEAGYEPGPAEPARGSTWQVGWNTNLHPAGSSPQAGAGSSGLAVTTECFRRYLAYVTEGRGLTLGEKGETGESPFGPEVDRCLADRGVVLEEEPSDSEVDVLNQCLGVQGPTRRG